MPKTRSVSRSRSASAKPVKRKRSASKSKAKSSKKHSAKKGSLSVTRVVRVLGAANVDMLKWKNDQAYRRRLQLAVLNKWKSMSQSQRKKSGLHGKLNIKKVLAKKSVGKKRKRSATKKVKTVAGKKRKHSSTKKVKSHKKKHSASKSVKKVKSHKKKHSASKSGRKLKSLKLGQTGIAWYKKLQRASQEGKLSALLGGLDAKNQKKLGKLVLRVKKAIVRAVKHVLKNKHTSPLLRATIKTIGHVRNFVMHIMSLPMKRLSSFCHNPVAELVKRGQHYFRNNAPILNSKFMAEFFKGIVLSKRKRSASKLRKASSKKVVKRSSSKRKHSSSKKTKKAGAKKTHKKKSSSKKTKKAGVSKKRKHSATKKRKRSASKKSKKVGAKKTHKKSSSKKTKAAHKKPVAHKKKVVSKKTAKKKRSAY